MAEGPRFVYLHGFASGPEGAKSTFLREKLAARGITLRSPALDEGAGGFHGLTVSRAIGTTLDALADAPPEGAVLIGSSFGGYVAALAALRSPAVRALLLLAPAFDLPARWTLGLGDEGMAKWRSTGAIEVDHHATGKRESLAFGFYRDALGHAPFPHVRVPCRVVHGLRDTVVPIGLSQKLRDGAPHVTLVELDDDHQLLASRARIWDELVALAGPLLP